MREMNETEFLQRCALAFLLILAAVFITSDGVKAQEYPDIQQYSGTFPNRGRLNYFWDERTQLCFASATSLTSGAYKITTFTNVPCTEKVWAVMRGQK